MSCKKIFPSLLASALLASCALQNVATGLEKYQQAVTRYEAKDYYQASQLLEEALPQLRGKKEEIAIHFYRAYCSFHQKKYEQSSARFKYFWETFVRDLRREEARYMQAYALYQASPYVTLEQVCTQEAVCILRDYLQQYPEGEHTEKAREQLDELDKKLALKNFTIGKLHSQLAQYKAAVVTLGNFQQAFPDSSYSEEAAYLKADAQHRYFKTVQEDEKKGQLSKTIKYCQEFLDNYPNSPYVSKVEAIYTSIATAQDPVTANNT